MDATKCEGCPVESTAVSWRTSPCQLRTLQDLSQSRFLFLDWSFVITEIHIFFDQSQVDQSDTAAAHSYPVTSDLSLLKSYTFL